jgi:hypothetical protein
MLIVLASTPALALAAASDLPGAGGAGPGCCTLVLVVAVAYLLGKRGLPGWLAAGIAVFPIGFAWFTLGQQYREGRTLAFAWLVAPCCLGLGSAAVLANSVRLREAAFAQSCGARWSLTPEQCSCVFRESLLAGRARELQLPEFDEAASEAARARCAPGATEGAGPDVGVVTVRVNSLPPGATVFLGRESTGKKTPTEVELRSGERATLEVRLGGYLPQRRDVQFRVGDPASVTFPLDAAASLVVKTSPPGARVLVDGAPAAGETPLELSGLEAKQARVAVQRPGMVSVVREVALRAGETVTLDEALVPAAFVALTTTPAGASVEVDGVTMPEVTPTPVPVIPNRRHEVVVSLPGTTPVKRSVRSGAAGSTVALVVELADSRLEALTAAHAAAVRAREKAEAALDRARERYDEAAARGAATEKVTRAVEAADDAFSRAEEHENETSAALDAYRERLERERAGLRSGP